jgi:hypothetical protein
MPKRFSLMVMFLLSLLLSLTACNGPDSDVALQESAESIDLRYEVLPLGPDEIYHISGDTSVETLPLQLEGAGGLSVYWRQTCSKFIISLLNTNQTLAEAPMGTVFFESILEPSEYVEAASWKKPFEYVPGEYTFSITAEGDDCQWEIWATITYAEEE